MCFWRQHLAAAAHPPAVPDVGGCVAVCVDEQGQPVLAQLHAHHLWLHQPDQFLHLCERTQTARHMTPIFLPLGLHHVQPGLTPWRCHAHVAAV